MKQLANEQISLAGYACKSSQLEWQWILPIKLLIKCTQKHCNHQYFNSIDGYNHRS